MGEKQKLVVKSNRLVEAGYRLDVVEQRMVMFSIVQARETGKGLTSRDFVSITAKDYAKAYPDTDESHAYRQLKESAKTLHDRKFTLYGTDVKTGKPEVTAYSWISAQSYVDGAGTVKLQFTPIVVEHITRLEHEFTSYRLEKIAYMSSVYAIRLYELLIQWGSIGKREIELAWLRKTLGLEGQYSSIKDFKKYVIDVALSQINEFSDLTASYTQRKTGRVVTHLLFTFSQKPPPKEESKQETAVAQPPKQPLPEPDGKSPFRLSKAPISQKTQADYLKVRTGEEIELCIERANEYGSEQEKAGKPVRYGALYRKAIEEGWHQEKARQKAQEDTARKQAEASRQQAAEAKRAEKEEAKRSTMERELAAAWFSALPDDEKETLVSTYVAESNPVDIRLFKRNGYDYPGFRFFIKRKWLESEKPIE
jgi:plasmid replication initiation protein